ncbi:TetR/AcrR family transcriptional regulator [Streptomyces sp. NPDC048665]|uniref:TetR/AcrR family transcriptional regulator n=1 Tax=Streptomyces sp. NPDC048665 TaxID=3155490 RepID=UPI003425AB61
MVGASVRTERAVETREAIMSAAERLFAQHGLAAVSSRQISEAAGQGNNAAVGYHFGSKAGLIEAMTSRGAGPVEQIRERLLAEIDGSDDIRDWVGCLVRPVTEYLDSLGTPSWHARFAAQVMTDPVLRAAVSEAAIDRPPLRRTLHELGRRLPGLPRLVRHERGEMARLLIVHTCAERERALAEGTGALQPSWRHTAMSLTDAITGLLLAPVTPRPHTPTKESQP